MVRKKYILITKDNIEFGIKRLRKDWTAAGYRGAISHFFAKYDGWSEEAMKIALDKKWIKTFPQGFKKTEKERAKLNVWK